MQKRSSKKPSPEDINQLAKWIAEASTQGKNPAAVILGRKGGLKGGKARAEKLSAGRRSEIARKAAEIRWSAERG